MTATTEVTITLDEDIDLLAEDVFVDFGGTGASRTTFTDNNDGTYTIGITGVVNTGYISVGIQKADYSFSVPSRAVKIFSGTDPHPPAEDVAFVSLTADGDEVV